MAAVATGSRKRVLFLIPTLTGGGAERVIVTLLKHLDRSRFELALAVVDTRDAVFRPDVPADVEFIDLGQRRVRHALPRLVRLIWQRRPDVVFSTLGHLNLALAILRPLLPSSPRFIARESNVPSQQLRCEPHPRLLGWLYRRFYRNHDVVVCQSRTMLVDLESNFALPRDRGIVIHNPVDVGRLQRLAAADIDEFPATGGTTSRLRLVSAGRLAEQKGFDLLIEAIALLRDIDLELTILGEGPLRADLEALTRRLGQQRRVRMVGFQSNPYAWFARADAFVLSSRYEGLPNVVLEALACGTQVIATPAAGVATEILQGVPGSVLSTEASAAAIAAAIRRWIGMKRTPVPDSALAPFALGHVLQQYEALLSRSG